MPRRKGSSVRSVLRALLLFFGGIRMENNKNSARAIFVLTMVIFGTIGLFRRYIPLSSGFLAMTRGFIGALFLLLLVMAKKRSFDHMAIRKNLLSLIVSGILIGFNWILLFEAYRYTTVATATLCYYLQPTFVMLASPLLLQERLTAKKALCAVVSLAGMVLVSGVLGTGFKGASELKGVAFALGAAALYACVVLINKRMSPISAYDKTSLQLSFASVVLLPYVLLTEKVGLEGITPFVIIMVLIVGIVHTGIAYALYFGSMTSLSGQTVAIFSYIDPIVAIILSALFLREPMTVAGVIGAVMILSAALAGELPEKEKR